MSGILDGQRALVIGSGANARGIAAAFAGEGAAVETGAAAPSSVEGTLDILVLDLLGRAEIAGLDEAESTRFDRALGTVTAMAGAMRAALPALKAANEGRIIVVGNRYGDSTGERMTPYSAAAWALHGLVRSAAGEWGQFGITTNLLVPLGETDEMAEARARRAKVVGLMTGQLALGRVGDPVADIGGAALMLASAEARFINGQVIHADGGQHIAAPVLNPAKFA